MDGTSPRLCPLESCKIQELLDTFMEGNMSLEDFLDSFQHSRRTYHMRRAQAEKMQDLIKKPPGKAGGGEDAPADVLEEVKAAAAEAPRPNGYAAQGPLRVFQVRYGLTPAILLPRYPLSPVSPAAQPQHARTPPPHPHPPGPGAPLQPVGLRVIGQLPGGWPAGGRPVRLQQLYRPDPQQPQPPLR